jgi:hypothetical protein
MELVSIQKLLTWQQATLGSPTVRHPQAGPFLFGILMPAEHLNEQNASIREPADNLHIFAIKSS